MSQQKRLSLCVRFQPVEGTPLSEVVKWLNQMSSSEKNYRIRQTLLMNFLPLARAAQGAEQEEIERIYRDFEKWFYQHQSLVRDELKIHGSGSAQNELREKMAESLSFAEKENQPVKKAKKVTSIFDALD